MSKRKKSKERRVPVFIALGLIIGAVMAYRVTYYSSEAIPARAAFFELGRASLVKKEKLPQPKVDINALRDISTLRNKYYAVDKKTAMNPELFNVDELMQEDITLKKSLFKPKVLIFHTHSHEMYADSQEGQGVVGAGERLKNVLEGYGVKCLHVTEAFDVVDGNLQILGAYERMEPRIRQILAENPSIEMVIDLHRDGVNEGVRLVSKQEGKDCAKIMFFNGLCAKVSSEGELQPADGLENPYIKQNLALSLKAQMTAESLYPNLNRKIYLNAYRYSLHFKPNSMLVELGAQTNTEAEVANAVDKLGEIIYKTVFQG